MRAAIQRDLSFDPPSRRVHPDGLERAKALGEKGLCIFCEDPLPAQDGPGRPRLICRKRGCRLAYHAARHRDRKVYWGYEFTRTFRELCTTIDRLLSEAPQALSNRGRAAKPEEAA